MVVRGGWIGLADDECAAAQAGSCRGGRAGSSSWAGWPHSSPSTWPLCPLPLLSTSAGSVERAPCQHGSTAARGAQRLGRVGAAPQPPCAWDRATLSEELRLAGCPCGPPADCVLRGQERSSGRLSMLPDRHIYL